MMREHCPFRKTILGGTCSCSLALKSHLPTGCSVSCSDEDAWQQCDDLLNEMIIAAKFVLQFIEDTDSLTHGKLMKIQHGGLLGLVKLVSGEETTSVDDIHGLVNSAKHRYTSLQDIPYNNLLDAIANWQLRRRRE